MARDRRPFRLCAFLVPLVLCATLADSKSTGHGSNDLHGVHHRELEDMIDKVGSHAAAVQKKAQALMLVEEKEGTTSKVVSTVLSATFANFILAKIITFASKEAFKQVFDLTTQQVVSAVNILYKYAIAKLAIVIFTIVVSVIEAGLSNNYLILLYNIPSVLFYVSEFKIALGMVKHIKKGFEVLSRSCLDLLPARLALLAQQHRLRRITELSAKAKELFMELNSASKRDENKISALEDYVEYIDTLSLSIRDDANVAEEVYLSQSADLDADYEAWKAARETKESFKHGVLFGKFNIIFWIGDYCKRLYSKVSYNVQAKIRKDPAMKAKFAARANLPIKDTLRDEEIHIHKIGNYVQNILDNVKERGLDLSIFEARAGKYSTQFTGFGIDYLHEGVIKPALVSLYTSSWDGYVSVVSQGLGDASLSQLNQWHKDPMTRAAALHMPQVKQMEFLECGVRMNIPLSICFKRSDYKVETTKVRVRVSHPRKKVCHFVHQAVFQVRRKLSGGYAVSELFSPTQLCVEWRQYTKHYLTTRGILGTSDCESTKAPVKMKVCFGTREAHTARQLVCAILSNIQYGTGVAESYVSGNIRGGFPTQYYQATSYSGEEYNLVSSMCYGAAINHDQLLGKVVELEDEATKAKDRISHVASPEEVAESSPLPRPEDEHDVPEDVADLWETLTEIDASDIDLHQVELVAGGNWEEPPVAEAQPLQIDGERRPADDGAAEVLLGDTPAWFNDGMKQVGSIYSKKWDNYISRYRPLSIEKDTKSVDPNAAHEQWLDQEAHRLHDTRPAVLKRMRAVRLDASPSDPRDIPSAVGPTDVDDVVGMTHSDSEMPGLMAR